MSGFEGVIIEGGVSEKDRPGRKNDKGTVHVFLCWKTGGIYTKGKRAVS